MTHRAEDSRTVFRRQLAAALAENTGRDWSQRRLAEALADIGSPLTRDVIAKIALGRRSPRLDEVLAIAYALGTSPIFLAIPQTHDVSLQVAPNLDPVTAVQAERWWQGDDPLPGQNEAVFHSLRSAAVNALEKSLDDGDNVSDRLVGPAQLKERGLTEAQVTELINDITTLITERVNAVLKPSQGEA